MSHGETKLCSTYHPPQGQVWYPPCKWLLVIITEHLFKLVHLSSPVTSGGSYWSMCRRHKRAVRIPLECFIVFIILISSNVDDTHTQMDSVAPNGAVDTAITFLRLKNADATTVWTRKHSSRMRTAHLETVGASASVATTRCCAGEVSLVWCPGGTRVDLSNRGREGSQVWCPWSILPCHLSHNVFYVTPPHSPGTDRHL